MKFFKIIAGLLFFCLSVNAQTELVGLKIGDKVPDVYLKHVLNYKTHDAKLSDFKGKLIILDFWATWCDPCIRAMPELNSLQNQFKNDIVVLAVTEESGEKVTKAHNNLPSLKSVTFPLVFADSALKKLFPYNGVPHDVIIGSDGIVKAITGLESINAQNISALLKNQEVSIPLKRTITPIPLNKPMFMEDKGEDILFHFLITYNYPGSKSSSNVEGKKDINGTLEGTRIWATNTRLLDLYRRAFLRKIESVNYFSNNRIALNVRDSSRFFPTGNSREWSAKNSYCVDLIVPPSRSSAIFDCLHDELDRVFDLQSKVEVRQLKCYYLTTIDSNKYHYSGKDVVWDLAKNLWTIKKTKFKYFVEQMNILTPWPIIDGTGFNGDIDIAIKPEFGDIISLNKQLNKYGLVLEERYEFLPVIVIADN